MQRICKGELADEQKKIENPWSKFIELDIDLMWIEQDFFLNYSLISHTQKKI